MLRRKGVSMLAKVLIIVIAALIFLAVFLLVMNKYSPKLEMDYHCPIFCKAREEAIESPGWCDYGAMITDPDNFFIGGVLLGPVKKYLVAPADPRRYVRPSEARCWCGVQEGEGKFLHIMMNLDDPDSPPTVLDYHLTNQPPTKHGRYGVPGNAVHFSSEGDVFADTNTKMWKRKWEEYREKKGCVIFAVRAKNGDGWFGFDLCNSMTEADGPALYGISNQTVIKGEIGSSISDDYDPKLITEEDPEAQSVLEVEFGATIEKGKDRAKGQFSLLKEYGETGKLELKASLACERVGGKYFWILKED